MAVDTAFANQQGSFGRMRSEALGRAQIRGEGLEIAVVHADQP